jgi:hypothetical protein
MNDDINHIAKLQYKWLRTSRHQMKTVLGSMLERE